MRNSSIVVTRPKKPRDEMPGAFKAALISFKAERSCINLSHSPGLAGFSKINARLQVASMFTSGVLGVTNVLSSPRKSDFR